MKGLTLKITYDHIIWFLTVILLAMFIILEKYSWGKYLFLIISFMIFIIDNFEHKGVHLAFERFQIKFGLFILFCFLTSIWSINVSNTIEFCNTLVLIYCCLFLIYPHFNRENNISRLLSAIMWASVIVAFYTIKYYGISTLIDASKTQYVRLGNDYSNINTVGMFCAFGVIVQFEKWLYEKKIHWSMIFVLVSFFVVACTQSRKALLSIIIGCLILVIMKNYKKGYFIQSLMKCTFIIMILIIIVLIMSKLSFFSGVQERLGQLFSIFTGKGELDSGSVNRQLLIELGFNVWKQHPILGIGLNCTRIIVNQVMGFNAYMHNNFIELLCATGIIGFLLYYCMYFYLLKQLLKYYKYDRRYFIFGIMWLIISLIMDIGMVSYYGKIQCFYLMAQFINVKKIKELTFRNGL